MANDSGLAAAIAVAIGLLIAAPLGIVVVLIRRAIRAGRIPAWALWIASPLGIAFGVWLAFFVVFDDLGAAFLARRSAPTIELRLPAEFRGRVTVFFDPELPAPRPVRREQFRTDVPTGGRPSVYRLLVPPSGELLVGAPPATHEQLGYLSFKLRYPDDSDAPQRPPPSSGGSFDNVVYAQFFVGDEREERLDREERALDGSTFDEKLVYRRLKSRAAAPPRP